MDIRHGGDYGAAGEVSIEEAAGQIAKAEAFVAAVVALLGTLRGD